MQRIPSIKLVTAETARMLDAAASAVWGLHPFALVEAAGRGCAQVFAESFPGFFVPALRVMVFAGSGNNGADAMVMLRAMILRGHVSISRSVVVINHSTDADIMANNPRAGALRSLIKMGVPVLAWKDARSSPGIFSPTEGAALPYPLTQADIIIDGIAGTGLKGPLRDEASDMVACLNQVTVAVQSAEGTTLQRPCIVSIDVPSGNGDLWEPGMPILKADVTLAIEPVKAALYHPAARPWAGTIQVVGEVFPKALIDAFEGAELLNWECVHRRIPRIRGDTYKHQRGVVEIWAGSTGSAGAARIAARGSQAAGAGLVRLMVDAPLYPILGASAGGVMVVPVDTGNRADGTGAGPKERFHPDAVLLGPGWGTLEDRAFPLHKALDREAQGTPLILDADAIVLAKDCVFHGNAILTPHPGEFTALTGISKKAVLAHPGPILTQVAREKRAVILFKSHVLIIAAEDGRLGMVDGMAPGLAAGGTGDLLAGLCAAIAARMNRNAQGFDGYTCAIAAATLLIATGTSLTFTDPLELADKAAAIAGAAWL
ncbi:MAG: bifunctional ADP-dependent NAD(P)H-hydrate dehydratase/NAD(P)H-hydrate epimerase [Treponema sp.]|nr:bifunctional ADP-dependent NAD(P)H-hydrate dehydratase/NAD(P)H-hydrate epimerase [Treponema sp.]